MFHLCSVAYRDYNMYKAAVMLKISACLLYCPKIISSNGLTVDQFLDARYTSRKSSSAKISKGSLL